MPVHGTNMGQVHFGVPRHGTLERLQYKERGEVEEKRRELRRRRRIGWEEAAEEEERRPWRRTGGEVSVAEEDEEEGKKSTTSMWCRLQEAMGEGDMDFRLMALDQAVIPVHKPCIAH